MSQLKVSSIRDLSDNAGFSFSGGGITTIGTLTVSNITINGQITGTSSYVIPPQAGNAGRYLQSTGSGMQWVEASSGAGIRSCLLYTSPSPRD